MSISKSNQALLDTIQFVIGAGGVILDARTNKYKELKLKHLKGHKNPGRALKMFTDKGYYTEKGHPAAVMELTDWYARLKSHFEEGGGVKGHPKLKKIEEVKAPVSKQLNYKWEPKTSKSLKTYINKYVKSKTGVGGGEGLIVKEDLQTELGDTLHEARKQYQKKDYDKWVETGLPSMHDPKRNFENFNELTKMVIDLVEQKKRKDIFDEPGKFDFDTLVYNIGTRGERHGFKDDILEEVKQAVAKSKEIKSLVKPPAVDEPKRIVSGEPLQRSGPGWEPESSEESEDEEDFMEREMVHYRTNWDKDMGPGDGGETFFFNWPTPDGHEFMVDQAGTIYDMYEDGHMIDEQDGGTWEENAEPVGHWDDADERPILYSKDYNYMYGLRSAYIAKRNEERGGKPLMDATWRGDEKDYWEKKMKHFEFPFQKHQWDWQDQMWQESEGKFRLADMDLEE